MQKNKGSKVCDMSYIAHPLRSVVVGRQPTLELHTSFSCHAPHSRESLREPVVVPA